MNSLLFRRAGGTAVGAIRRTPTWFRRWSTMAAKAMGSPWTFLIAVVFIIAWALSGFWLRFSDTWQLIINTATSVVTFLAVFLIQHTQNREASAMHLKLDELIRAVEGARNHLVHLEDLDDEELERLEEQFRRFRERGLMRREPKKNGGG